MAPAPRPPTPPRVSSSNSSMPPCNAAKQHAQQPPLVPLESGPATPHAAGALNPLTSIQATAKRVGFSPLPSYIQPDVFTEGPRSTTPLRNVTPSRDCRPGKSILKSVNAAKTTSVAPTAQPSQSAAVFLEAALQELTSGDRTSRIDAYVTLARSWKLYMDMPDGASLLQGVPGISRFIRRDIIEVGDDYEPQNINVVHQALALMMVLVMYQGSSSRLPDDIKTFIIDQSVAALQSRKLPKLLVTDYLKLISLQQLSPRSLPSGRVSQILTALHSLTDHVEGKAIVSQRIAVYAKLFRQVRPIFVNQASLWIEHLITAFFHPLEEIWKRAIYLALSISSEGPSAQVSKALRAVLDIPRDNGSKFLHTLCERLGSMVSKRNQQVPLIWSTILLLLRSSKFNLERWPDLKEWLLVLERCFNTTDSGIRSEAFRAWNRLIYCLLPSELLSKRTVIMLGRPMFSQLDRRKPDRAVMNRALQSYNFLLYLAFHPSTTAPRLELYWQEYINQAFEDHWAKNSATHRRACDILAALLWNAHPKVWDERKVSNPETHLETSDLPRIDPKWVKSRLSIVLPAFETLLKNASWTTDNFGESGVGIGWSNLCRTLADACSKEITPSADTMQALASLLGMFQRVWKTSPASLNVSEDNPERVYDIFKFLYTTLASHLGSILSSDRRLLKTSQETYQTTTTPTHRHPASNKHQKTPTLHFMHMIFSHLPAPPQESFNSLFEAILEASINARISTSAQLEIYRQVHELLPGFLNSSDYQEHLNRASQVILKSTRLLLSSPASQKLPGGVQQQLDEVLDILSSAVSLGTSPSEWKLTFIKLVNHAKEQLDDEAAIRIIDLLSSSPVALLGTELRSFGIDYCTELTKQAEIICASISKDRSRDTIKRYSPAAALKHLHTLINLCLFEIYNEIGSIPVASAKEFIKATQSYLTNTGVTELPEVFALVHEGLIVYLKDGDRLILEEECARPVASSIRNLTARTSKLLWRTLENDPSKVHTLAPIIVGGLVSASQSTVDYSVNMWNKIFGHLSVPRCPESITKALSTLKPGTGATAPILVKESESESEDFHVHTKAPKTKTAQSNSNSKSKVNSRKATPTTVQEHDTPAESSLAPSTPEADLFCEEDPNGSEAANFAKDGTQDDRSLIRKPGEAPIRGVFAGHRNFDSNTSGYVDLWQSTLSSPGLGNDSDVPASSPTPGSKGIQSQQSLLTQESTAAQSPAYPIIPLEKQVSQTELIEETILYEDTEPPNTVQVEDTILVSSPQERDYENAIIYEPASPAESSHDETLQPSQGVPHYPSIGSDVDEHQPKIPEEDLVASQLTVDLEMSMGLDADVHPDMASTAPQNAQKRKRNISDEDNEQSDSSDSQKSYRTRSQRRKKNRKTPLEREHERSAPEAISNVDMTPSRMTRSSSRKLKNEQEGTTAQSTKPKSSSQTRKQRRKSSGSRKRVSKGRKVEEETIMDQDVGEADVNGEDTPMVNDEGTSGEPSQLSSSNIVGQLEAVLSNIKSSELDMKTARAIDDTLFQIKLAAYHAVEKQNQQSSDE